MVGTTAYKYCQDNKLDPANLELVNLHPSDCSRVEPANPGVCLRAM